MCGFGNLGVGIIHYLVFGIADLVGAGIMDAVRTQNTTVTLLEDNYYMIQF